MKQTYHQTTEADAPTRQARVSPVAVTSKPWPIRAEGCNRRFVPPAPFRKVREATRHG